METFLVLNEYEIVASTDEQERVMLDLAAGRLGRAEFTEWLRAHLAERQTTLRGLFATGTGTDSERRLFFDRACISVFRSIADPVGEFPLEAGRRELGQDEEAVASRSHAGRGNENLRLNPDGICKMLLR